jgi:hypothetical protein
MRDWIHAPTGASMRRVLRTTIALLAVALVAAVPAGAKRIVVRVSLAPGKLRIAAAPTVVPAGAQRAISVRVADARGSGRGWTLRLVRAGGLTVTSITARCAAGSTCTLPRALAAPKSTTVLQAARGTGMGIVDLVVTVRAVARTTASFAVS